MYLLTFMGALIALLFAYAKSESVSTQRSESNRNLDLTKDVYLNQNDHLFRGLPNINEAANTTTEFILNSKPHSNLEKNNLTSNTF